MKYEALSATGRLAAISLAAVIMAGGYAVLRSSSSSGATTLAAADAIASVPSELRWEAGKEYLFDLHWNGTSRVQIPGAQEPVDVTVNLEGALRARAVAEARGVADVVMSLSDIRVYDVRMQGKPMFDDATAPVEKGALVGQEVRVAVDRQGTVVSLAFDAATPARVRQILERVVEALHVTLPPGADARTRPGDSWEAEETTPTGTCKVRYRREPSGALMRERLSYTAVTAIPTEPGELDETPPRVVGGATITLDKTGGLTSIDDSETVTIDSEKSPYRASSRFKLTRRAVAPFDAKSLDLARFTDTRQSYAASDKGSDESVVQGMTADALLAAVVDHDRGTKLPRGFMVHASAYGRLHPEESATLAQVFVAQSTHARSRTLIMDILAATGDAAAQEAMGTIVLSKEARADKEGYVHYLQRFMLVPKPARATAELLLGIYTDAKKAKEPSFADAAAAPLGAIAKKLDALGEGDLSRKIHARLLADLEAATGDDSRIALLKGIGNGAFPEDDVVVAKYAKSPAAHVRDQAAFSVRNIDSPLSRATLLELTQDKNQNIAVTAVRALKRQSLSPEEWKAFRSLVVLGKTPLIADSEVVALLVNAVSEPGEEARPILLAIRARAREGSDLYERADHLLQEDP